MFKIKSKKTKFVKIMMVLMIDMNKNKIQFKLLLKIKKIN